MRGRTCAAPWSDRSSSPSSPPLPCPGSSWGRRRGPARPLPIGRRRRPPARSLDARRQADAAAQAFADAQADQAEAEDDAHQDRSAGAGRVQAGRRPAPGGGAARHPALRAGRGRPERLPRVRTGGRGPAAGRPVRGDRGCGPARRTSTLRGEPRGPGTHEGRAASGPEDRAQRAAKNLNARHKQLENQITKLQKAERKRQKDAAVRRALEAQRQAELARHPGRQPGRRGRGGQAGRLRHRRPRHQRLLRRQRHRLRARLRRSRLPLPGRRAVHLRRHLGRAPQWGPATPGCRHARRPRARRRWPSSPE